MQSHTKLHFNEIRCEIITHERQNLTTCFPYSDKKKHILKEGHIITQSISFYFAFVELIEYALTQNVGIDISVTKPSIFMLSELNNSSCNLCYCPTGSYKKQIPAGENTMMVITFREDWFLYKCKNLPEFKSIISSFRQRRNTILNLEPTNIATNVFNALRKFESNVGEIDDGYLFVNGCIEKYYNKIKSRNNTAIFHQGKAANIAQYIAKHFTSDIVDDIPKLCKIFMVSERSLARLAKLAFGRPLHEQVIKLRIEYAIELLLKTDQPIKEISYRCGYNDPYYFSKAFKKGSVN